MMILGITLLYILHWLIHFKLYVIITTILDEEIGEIEDGGKIFGAIISLIPIVSTIIIIIGVSLIIKDKNADKVRKNYIMNFLTFIANLGNNSYSKLQKKKEEQKKKKDQYDKFDILDIRKK